MSRYIEIDTALLKTVPAGKMSAKALWKRIMQQPSIDIVRCRECKYASDNKVYGCMLNHFNDDDYHRMYADDFCSYGVRTDASETDKHDEAVEALAYLIKHIKGADDE